MNKDSILFDNLKRKPVVSNDGKSVGRLHTVRIDEKTGEITYLIVSKEKHNQTTKWDTNKQGRYKIPSENIVSLSDNIIVQSRES